MSSTFDKLIEQSNLSPDEATQFKRDLDQQLDFDNHDLAVQERMEIVSTCYQKNVNSVIVSIPSLEELYGFKKCVRKYARVKMRAINYYHYDLNSEKEPTKPGEVEDLVLGPKYIHKDYLLTNLKRFNHLIRQQQKQD